MFLKSSLAVDIGAGTIKLLYGNRNKVKICSSIKTPVDSVVDNKIVDIDAVYGVIFDFIYNNKIRPKDISYAIYGQDIVIRHIEVPNMKEDSIKQAVDWEVGQNLPEGGANFYIDYEILDKKDAKRLKTFQAIVVAVPKPKIDGYIELTDRLKLKLRAIDISANCVARVFKDCGRGKEKPTSVGIIDIGSMTTGITILDHGRIFIERAVPFGMEKLMREVGRKLPNVEGSAYSYLMNNFNFDEVDMENEIDTRLKTLFDNVFSSFQKVIQFYSTGRIEKNIAQLYVIGGGNGILGLKNYIQNYLSSPTTIVSKPSSIGCKIKIPSNCDFKYYISALGLLLRED